MAWAAQPEATPPAPHLGRAERNLPARDLEFPISVCPSAGVGGHIWVAGWRPGWGEQQRQCSWRSREERTLIEIAPFILTGDFSLRVSLDENDIPVHRGLKPKSMPSLICSSKPRSTPNSL